jgi:hypothetical protein
MHAQRKEWHVKITVSHFLTYIKTIAPKSFIIYAANQGYG